MGSQNGEVIFLGLQERLARFLATEMAIGVAQRSGMEKWDKEYVVSIAKDVMEMAWWGKGMEVK